MVYWLSGLSAFTILPFVMPRLTKIEKFLNYKTNDNPHTSSCGIST